MAARAQKHQKKEKNGRRAVRKKTPKALQISNTDSTSTFEERKRKREREI